MDPMLFSFSLRSSFAREAVDRYPDDMHRCLRIHILPFLQRLICSASFFGIIQISEGEWASLNRTEILRDTRIVQLLASCD